jgi:hypothetical protein
VLESDGLGHGTWFRNRNTTTSGSRIDLHVGLASGRSCLSLEQDYDINLYALFGGTRITTKALHLIK